MSPVFLPLEMQYDVGLALTFSAFLIQKNNLNLESFENHSSEKFNGN